MLVFGINKEQKRLTKVAEDTFPVLTVLPKPNQKGFSHRMLFNHELQRLMRGKQWTIGAHLDEGVEPVVFFIDTASLPEGTETNIVFEVYNNGHLNSAKLWKYLRKIYLEEEKALRFKIVQSVIEDLNVLEFQAYEPDITRYEQENVYLNVEEELPANELEGLFSITEDIDEYPLTPEEALENF